MSVSEDFTTSSTLPPTRDRYGEASNDLASHIGDKILTVMKHPDNQVRIQSILDPIVSHIIQRVFPYILLSAILFLILFILSVGTFWIVMRSGVGSPAAAAAISVGIK